jgi:hypothetical protein
MSLPDREIDPMALLHRASSQEAVPAETRARVWAGVSRALLSSVAEVSAASSPAASAEGAKNGASLADGSPAVLASAGQGLRPWLSKFLHWSAPALVIGAAAGATARHALIPAELPVLGAASGVAEPKALPSPAPESAGAKTEVPAPAAADNAQAPPIVAPSGESSVNPKRVSGAHELARERALLDQARARIAAGEPARALDFVERHERRHAQGALSEEREALAVNALVSIGRYRDAAQRGEAFRVRYPQSLLMPSVDAALAAIPAP